MAYRVIQEMSRNHSVSLLCKIAHISKSGYYKWIQRQRIETSRQREERNVKELIVECYREVRGIYGYYRITAWLRKKYGLTINHKRVYRLMKELGIQAKIRKKNKFYSRRSEHITAPNLLNRDFKAARPNEKWATDVTYLQFQNQTLYLSTIYDMFNNEVISYKISERNDLKFVIETVTDACKKRDVTGVLLHSDQGSQYTSRQYKKILKKHHITQSMSRKGNCLDNACMENFFGHLKAELMYINRFRNKMEVIHAVHEYIQFYNEQRIQRKLNGLSPVEYRTKAA
ncbi:MAG: IS3 family transposase [Tumebacillaceae bacterium]